MEKDKLQTGGICDLMLIKESDGEMHIICKCNHDIGSIIAAGEGVKLADSERLIVCAAVVEYKDLAEKVMTPEVNARVVVEEMDGESILRGKMHHESNLTDCVKVAEYWARKLAQKYRIVITTPGSDGEMCVHRILPCTGVSEYPKTFMGVVDPPENADATQPDNAAATDGNDSAAAAAVKRRDM